MKIQKELAK